VPILVDLYRDHAVCSDADTCPVGRPEQKDLAEYNPNLDQTIHHQDAITDADDLASRVGGDHDSILQAPAYPGSLARTYSQQSGQTGYYARENESEVDLVHSAAPFAGEDQGYYSRQQPLDVRHCLDVDSSRSTDHHS
jgi:hypothetical protein